MKSIQTDVCIIGGGPAGLTLALELVKKNLRVIVVEQAKHYDRSFRGESLSPDSVYILDYLEILDKLEQKGFISTNNLEIVENEDTDFECVEDTITVVVKTRSIKNDKYKI